MAIRLFNTMSRKKERFRPLQRGVVRMYSCGPTVYNFAHLGNLRTYIFSDVLKRVLTHHGYRVKHVMNVTDVGHLTGETTDSGEDKLEAGAAREGKTIWEIAAYYTKAFEEDAEELRILRPTKFARATDHIGEQIAMVKQLFRKGYAYDTSAVVYFDTAQLHSYGRLARLKLKGLKPGARVPFDVKKRNPADFALWFKTIGAHERHVMRWPSPWGDGFPGWHLECAAMARKYLGQPFDIHTGGVDLIHPHHTNEEAEAEAAYGKPLARYWLHGEHLLLGRGGGEQRMAKSLGNLLTIRDVGARGVDPLAFRYLCLTTHYRSKLYFTAESLRAAEQGLRRLRQGIQALPPPARRGVPAAERRFTAAVGNDLDLPRALATAWALLRARGADPAAKRRSFLAFDAVFGLDLGRQVDRATVPAAVMALVQAREDARVARAWDRADELRRQIQAAGYAVGDTPAGPQVKRAP